VCVCVYCIGMRICMYVCVCIYVWLLRRLEQFYVCVLYVCVCACLCVYTTGSSTPKSTPAAVRIDVEGCLVFARGVYVTE